MSVARTQAGPPSGQSVVTIGQFLATLRRQLLRLVVLVILGVLAAGALLLSTAKTYQATAVVDISPTSSNAPTSTVSTITESRIVTSTSVALAAQQTLGYPGTPTALARQVTVSSPLASQVLNITFTAGTAQDAADGANAFAHAYLDYRTQIAQKDITLRIGRIQSQVADLQKSLASLKAGQNDTQRGLLQNQIQQLQNQLNTYQTSVVTPGQVAGAAVAPSSPSSPRPPLYLAGGLLIGLLVGIVLAVARDRRDDRVRDAADLEHSLGAPVIIEAVTTEGRTLSLAATDATRGAEADAYRTLTTAVTSHSAGSRIVLLCGAGQDGLSLAPLNLAATFAAQGLRTVLAGPHQALKPATELLELQSLPSAPARLADRLAPSKKVDRLLVLSLGDEVLLGATLRDNGDNLTEILAEVDVIVLDGLNVELPSTSLRLGQLADEAVVVAYKNRSTHSEIERLARQLAQVSADVLGGVLLSRRSGLRRRSRRADAAPRRSSSGAGHRDDAKAQPAARAESAQASDAVTGSAAIDSRNDSPAGSESVPARTAGALGNGAVAHGTPVSNGDPARQPVGSSRLGGSGSAASGSPRSATVRKS